MQEAAANHVDLTPGTLELGDFDPPFLVIFDTNIPCSLSK